MNSSDGRTVYSWRFRSTARTQFPSAFRRFTMCPPMNPPAPFTRILFIHSPPLPLTEITVHLALTDEQTDHVPISTWSVNTPLDPNCRIASCVQLRASAPPQGSFCISKNSRGATLGGSALLPPVD